MEEIEVTISADGKVRVHVTGVPGEICLEKTAELTALLGNSMLTQEKTAEYFSQEKQQKSAVQMRMGR